MKYLGTLIGCTAMLLFTVPRHGGFLLSFFLIFLIPLFVYSGVRMVRRPNERKLRGSKLAVWMLAVSVVLVVNFYRYQSARNVANDVIAKINKYYEIHSAYPSNLEAIGYDRSSLKGSLGMYGYSNENGKPSFFYGVPYQIYDAYKYDFQSKQWMYSEAS